MPASGAHSLHRLMGPAMQLIEKGSIGVRVLKPWLNVHSLSTL